MGADAVRSQLLLLFLLAGQPWAASGFSGAVQEVDIVVDGLGHTHHSALPTSAKCGYVDRMSQAADHIQR